MDESEPNENLLIPYRITFASVIAIGIMINYKLYENIRKETPGEKGKVFQQIMKRYAKVQVFGWTFIWIWLTALQSTIIYKVDYLIPPCIKVYAMHIGMFSFYLVRSYVGFNSLILAIGRYIFVVLDGRVMNWGIEKVSRVLILLSSLVPFFTAILTSSVLTLQYTSWLAPIREYEEQCYRFTTQHETRNNFRSPLYDLAHSIFPSWITDCFFILFVICLTLIYTNVAEGFIYTKAALFIFR